MLWDVGDLRLEKKENKSDLPTVIANMFIKQISNGHIKSGDYLPSELELTRKLGISRISLREALKYLEAKGYIVTIQKSKKMVKSTTDEFIFPLIDLINNSENFPGCLRDLISIKKFVDGECAVLSSSAINKETIAQLRRIINNMAGYCLKPQFSNSEITKLYYDFLQIFCISSNNLIMSNLADSIYNVIIQSLKKFNNTFDETVLYKENFVSQLSIMVDHLENRKTHLAKESAEMHVNIFHSIVMNY